VPEITAKDLTRIRHAVQLRDRCRAAAVANGERLDIPISPVQANVAFDAMEQIIREDERARRDADVGHGR
jgi:hypothetical protein